MIFYYVRHGEPVYSPDSLTQYGEQQAEALAARFALYGLDIIYTSPSRRAFQTAQATCDLLKKQPVVLDWADEGLAWNDFTILKQDKRRWIFQDEESVEKFSSCDVLKLGKNWARDVYFDKTNVRMGLKRVDTETDLLFLQLGFKHHREKGGYEVLQPNKNRVALFAHQGFGIAFLSSLLDIPYPIFCTRFDMGHSGVTVVYFDESKAFTFPKVLQLSNDSHLYKEELLKGYQGWIDI